jgi:hypothetical protein
LINHDENLDEEIDQQDTQVYEHIDKPLVHELYPIKRKRFFKLNFKHYLLANYNKDDI